MKNKIILAFLVWMAWSATTFATPSISVTRTPSTGNVGDAYSVSWSSAGAAKVGYRCTWAWNGTQDDLSAAGLWLGGTVSGKYDDGMVWSTNCVWTATATDGTSATASETFSVTKKAWSVFENFAISKISGTPYAWSPISLAVWARSFSIEGVGAPGANVVVASAGCVYLNQSARSDGSWTVTVSDNGSCKLPASGAFQFSVAASKAYYGEAVRYATVAFPSSTTANMGKVQCRAGSDYSETNFYAKRGESVICTVSSGDTKTRLMMNSGYVSWGDVVSTKSVEPQTVSEIPTSCQSGVCSATFVSDYAGYSKSREVWFQDSAGTKSASVSYVSADPNSQDYADAIAYQKKKYQSSEAPSTTPGEQTGGTSGASSSNGTASTASSNGAVSVVTVTWAKFSNGKVFATEGQSFILAWSANARSQMRMYRKGSDSDGVSTSSDDSGKWSLFWLSAKWYPRVFKTGTYQYVIESVSSDGKSKSATTVEIEIATAAETKASSSWNASSASSSSENRQTSVPKISAVLKSKLDAFVSILEEKARAKWNAKASREYVAAVRSKLVALRTKYRKTGKATSVAAITYLIERADEVSEKFAEPLTEEDSLIKDLKESY